MKRVMTGVVAAHRAKDAALVDEVEAWNELSALRADEPFIADEHVLPARPVEVEVLRPVANVLFERWAASVHSVENELHEYNVRTI